MSEGLDRKIYTFFRKHTVDWLKMVGISTVVGAETVDVLTRNSVGDILSCSGLVKPTDATDGYAKGCTFIKTDAAAGSKSIYENTGTKDSCVFNLAGEEVPGDLVLTTNSMLVGVGGYGSAMAIATNSLPGRAAADVVDITIAQARVLGRITGGSLGAIQITDEHVDAAADITSTKIDFDHGITMAGALAVGIELTGTYTDGIDLSAATLTQASDNALFSIGSYGTAKVVALTSAAFYTPFQINLLSSANPSGGETIMAGGYIKVATNTIDQPAMNSVALNLRNTIGMSLVSAYGLQSHMTFVTTAELDGAGTASPISGKITLGHANTSGVIAVGYFTLDGAFAPAAPTYGVWIDIVDATATAGLIIASSGTGKMSKGISLSSAVMAEGTDNALFCIGSYSSAKSVTLATNAFYVPFHINILSTANPAGGETIMSGTYVKAATTGNQADMNLVGETVRVTVGGNVAQAYGVQCHLTVSGACVAGTNANVCAGSFKTVVNAAMTATVNVMLLTYENATATVIAGEKNILTLDPTAAVTNYFMLYNTANATNLFAFQAAAACAAGASKNGASTGSIKIVIGGTSYYIPYYV